MTDAPTEGLQFLINNMRKKQQVWIVVNKERGAYVDHRYTKKEMMRHHCDTLGYMHFDEAKDKGDRCVKAILQYVL